MNLQMETLQIYEEDIKRILFIFCFVKHEENFKCPMGSKNVMKQKLRIENLKEKQIIFKKFNRPETFIIV